MTKLPKSVLNYVLYEDTPSGYTHLEVEHDGTATWFDLQTVKNNVLGKDRICFELYPPQDQVVNGESKEFHYRHLWVWPAGATLAGKPWPNIRGK